MKGILVLWLAAAVAGTALAPTASSQVVKEFSLDDASAIGLKIQTDTAVKSGSPASVRIETLWPVTVCLAQVDGLDVETAALVYQGRVKTDIVGAAYLELWVEVGGQEYFSRGMDNAIEGSSDWKTLQTPFFLRKGQKAQKATLNIVINGHGTVWVDSLVLLKRAPGGK
jgi:hypothetical protein